MVLLTPVLVTSEVEAEGGSVILCLALWVGDGILIGLLDTVIGNLDAVTADLDAVIGDLDAVTGDRDAATDPPLENVLSEEDGTLGTVGILAILLGTGVWVVKLGMVGRSGTAGTGWRRGPEEADLTPTGSEGTAGTGSGRMFCTGAISEADLGVSRKEPRWTTTSSLSVLKAVKAGTMGSLVSLASGSRPPV